jgi:hypothetical protein
LCFSQTPQALSISSCSTFWAFRLSKHKGRTNLALAGDIFNIERVKRVKKEGFARSMSLGAYKTGMVIYLLLSFLNDLFFLLVLESSSWSVYAEQEREREEEKQLLRSSTRVA